MVEITPTDAYGYYGLGRSLARLGRSAEARGQLKLAEMLSPQKRSATVAYHSADLFD